MVLFSSLWLIFTLAIVNNVKGVSKIEEYLGIIREVYKFYKASSIVFMYSGNYTDMSEKNEILNIAMSFPRESKMTILLTFEEANQFQSYYQDKEMKINKIKQPMIVAFLTTSKSLEIYTSILQVIGTANAKHKIHQYQHLALFMKIEAENEKPLLDFCTNPVGNQLSLRFDSRMLIKCYDDINIREWYSIWENETIICDLATLDRKSGLLLKTNLTLYERRSGLRGKKLRIAILKESNLIQRKENKLIGYIGYVLEILQETLNFTVDINSDESLLGNWNENNRTWSGAINLLLRGKVDIVASDVTVTVIRLRYIDFATPFIKAENFLFIKKPENFILWSKYIQPFTISIWSIFLLFVLVTPILITLIKMKIQKIYSLLNLISENYLNIIGIFCQQGLTECPTATTLRVAYFSIFCLSFIMWSVYCASLTSLENIPKSYLSLETLTDFVADGSYNLIVLRDSVKYLILRNQSSDNEIFKGIKRLLLEKSKQPLTITEGFRMVCEEKVAFYINNIFHSQLKESIMCELIKIPMLRDDHIGIVLPKNSQFTDVFNYHIQKLHDFGLLSYFRLNHLETSVDNPQSLNKFIQVDLSVIALPLTIIVCGIILGVTTFCLEKIYFNCKNNKSNSVKSLSSGTTVNSEQWKTDEPHERRKYFTKDRVSRIKFLQSSYEHRIVLTPGDNTVSLKL